MLLGRKVQWLDNHFAHDVLTTICSDDFFAIKEVQGRVLTWAFAEHVNYNTYCCIASLLVPMTSFRKIKIYLYPPYHGIPTHPKVLSRPELSATQVRRLNRQSHSCRTELN